VNIFDPEHDQCGLPTRPDHALRMAVLGGTGSGVPTLIADLQRAQMAKRIGPLDIRLHGRNRLKLARVYEYVFWDLASRQSAADSKLTLSVHTELASALQEADVILCLIRPGGMHGRAEAEAAAFDAGIPADEGIAAGGLACFLRGRSLVRELAVRCRDIAPQAVFLQMSSPLGLNVAITRAAFGPNVIGLCELPRTTLRSVLRHVNGRMKEPCTTARCAGLNHQSWLYAFEDGQGVDRTADVLDAFGDDQLVKIDADEIRAHGAIPLPYLRLYLHTKRVLQEQARTSARGACLVQWSEQLHNAFCGGDRTNYEQVRSLLAERRMDWFEEAVIPFLEAWCSTEPRRLTLNVINGETIREVPACVVVETDCMVASSYVRSLDAPPLPPRPAQLLAKLAKFERAVLALPDRPSTEDLAELLSLHPLTPPDRVYTLARELSRIATVRS
jgi:6-phospho-beta-glucosidase